MGQLGQDSKTDGFSATSSVQVRQGANTQTTMLHGSNPSPNVDDLDSASLNFWNLDPDGLGCCLVVTGRYTRPRKQKSYGPSIQGIAATAKRQCTCNHTVLSSFDDTTAPISASTESSDCSPNFLLGQVSATRFPVARSRGPSGMWRLRPSPGPLGWSDLVAGHGFVLSSVVNPSTPGATSVLLLGSSLSADGSPPHKTI